VIDFATTAEGLALAEAEAAAVAGLLARVTGFFL
jgi:hypothetical protein